jgi:Tfp pilus assembly protein PilO
MKMSKSNLAVLGLIAVVVLGGAFWMLVLSPKREEVSKLDEQVVQVKSSLAQHEAEIVAAEQARESFPAEYQKLVVLGKAVPGDDDVASLLVQVNRIADEAGVRFNNLELSGGGGESAPEGSSVEGSTPTEAAAALLPLGATIGPAGLGVMPYTLTFSGSFFQIADFIKGLDSMVDTRKGEVRVDGRLMTIDDFSLSASEGSSLTATFSVTTYLTPPGEAPSAAAEGSAPVTAAPVSTTTGVAR